MRIASIIPAAIYGPQASRPGAAGRVYAAGQAAQEQVQQGRQAEAVVEGEVLRRPGAGYKLDDMFYHYSRRSDAYGNNPSEASVIHSSRQAIASYLSHAQGDGPGATRNAYVDFYV